MRRTNFAPLCRLLTSMVIFRLIQPFGLLFWMRVLYSRGHGGPQTLSASWWQFNHASTRLSASGWSLATWTLKIGWKWSKPVNAFARGPSLHRPKSTTTSFNSVKYRMISPQHLMKTTQHLDIHTLAFPKVSMTCWTLLSSWRRSTMTSAGIWNR